MRIDGRTGKALLTAVFIAAAVLSLTGCSDYDADVPEYTTGDDRTSSFRATTFEEQHAQDMPSAAEGGAEDSVEAEPDIVINDE